METLVDVVGAECEEQKASSEAQYELSVGDVWLAAPPPDCSVFSSPTTVLLLRKATVDEAGLQAFLLFGRGCTSRWARTCDINIARLIRWMNHDDSPLLYLQNTWLFTTLRVPVMRDRYRLSRRVGRIQPDSAKELLRSVMTGAPMKGCQYGRVPEYQPAHMTSRHVVTSQDLAYAARRSLYAAMGIGKPLAAV